MAFLIFRTKTQVTHSVTKFQMQLVTLMNNKSRKIFNMFIFVLNAIENNCEIAIIFHNHIIYVNMKTVSTVLKLIYF